MSLILSLDTSTPICSAALHEEGQLVIAKEIHEGQVHGARLAPMIKDLFVASGRDQKELKAVSVTSGPGSYTGLRIGTSTAKGICYALNIPLIACDTLTVLATHVRDMGVADGLLCPMLDARRMEVYCAVFNSKLEVILPVEAKIVDGESFSEMLLNHKMIFFGDGSAKCKQVLQHDNAHFLNDIFPSGAALGPIAWKKFQAGETEDLVHFEPIYLKEFLIKKSTKLNSLLNK
jgi:tRNA threonylcarbamoyladenosine biosynthesis protein TsaB